MAKERGRFHHPQRARQLLSFEGLRWGTITPTDFDLFIDYQGRAFVLAELKHEDAPLHRGQELAIERVVDAWEKAGIPALALVASHSIDIGDVTVAHARVVRVRWKGRWVSERRNFSVAQVIERFFIRVNKGAA